jgi:hypothetical protein
VAGRLQKTNGPRLSELLCCILLQKPRAILPQALGPSGPPVGCLLPRRFFFGVGGKPLNRRERERERDPKDKVRGGPLGYSSRRTSFLQLFGLQFPMICGFWQRFRNLGHSEIPNCEISKPVIGNTACGEQHLLLEIYMLQKCSSIHSLFSLFPQTKKQTHIPILLKSLLLGYRQNKC